MEAGANKDYKFGSKNNYRRWLWNRIAERTNDKKNALILYLPGIQNIDGIIATSKGFKQDNMIAVERDKQAIRRLRKLGINTIEGEVVDVLGVWSKENPLDVLYLDFCSGLTAQAMALVHRLTCSNAIHPMPISTTVCLNFLRGRDKYYDLPHGIEGLPTTHRGAKFFVGAVGYLSNKITKDKDMVDLLATCMINECYPIFNSYKSGNVYMDSVVYSLTLPPARRGKGEYCKRDANIFKTYKARVSAALAHRTMRMNR